MQAISEPARSRRSSAEERRQSAQEGRNMERSSGTRYFFLDDKGPIECLSWGAFIVGGQEHAESDNGRIGAGKDIRVIGEKVTRWKERKGHKLKKSMITGVYDHGLEALIIGTGIEGAIEVPEKVKADIEQHGIPELIVEPTTQACHTYNNLFHQRKRVALLAHGTC